MITGCEACSENAEIPFDNILDRLTGSDPSVTDYVLEVPTRCLHAAINEKTLSGMEPARLTVTRNTTIYRQNEDKNAGATTGLIL